MERPPFFVSIPKFGYFLKPSLNIKIATTSQLWSLDAVCRTCALMLARVSLACFLTLALRNHPAPLSVRATRGKIIPEHLISRVAGETGHVPHGHPPPLDPAMVGWSQEGTRNYFAQWLLAHPSPEFPADQLSAGVSQLESRLAHGGGARAELTRRGVEAAVRDGRSGDTLDGLAGRTAKTRLNLHAPRHNLKELTRQTPRQCPDHSGGERARIRCSPFRRRKWLGRSLISLARPQCHA